MTFGVRTFRMMPHFHFVFVQMIKEGRMSILLVF